MLKRPEPPRVPEYQRKREFWSQVCLVVGVLAFVGLIALLYLAKPLPVWAGIAELGAVFLMLDALLIWYSYRQGIPMPWLISAIAFVLFLYGSFELYQGALQATLGRFFG